MNKLNSNWQMGNSHGGAYKMEAEKANKGGRMKSTVGRDLREIRNDRCRPERRDSVEQKKKKNGVAVGDEDVIDVAPGPQASTAEVTAKGVDELLAHK